MKATITAASHYLPENIISNSDMEKFVETSDEWIQSRTGIKQRHKVKNGEATSSMGIKVANDILEKKKINAKEIDVIITATITPDMLFPSTASIIQKEIGAINAWAFDLNAACSGFLFSLETAQSLIESKKYKKILVIGGDTMSSIIDYNDRATCVLFGDGAGAILLEPSSHENGIIDSVLFTDGTGGDRLYMPGGGSLFPSSKKTIDSKFHYLKQDGREVYKSAVRGMTEAALEILKRNSLSSNDIKLFIPHQANKRIIEACSQRLNLNSEQVYINIDRFANTTGGTIPICISEAVQKNLLSEGDLILLAAFGAGFTWGATLIKWGNFN